MEIEFEEKFLGWVYYKLKFSPNQFTTSALNKALKMSIEGFKPVIIPVIQSPPPESITELNVLLPYKKTRTKLY